MKEKPYIETRKVIITRSYNPNYGDDKICKCGHEYHRHFDSYEDMDACGCKYCSCDTFELKIIANYIVTTRDFNGKKITECESKEDVYEAIGSMNMGGMYEVESPTGKDTSEFIPF